MKYAPTTQAELRVRQMLTSIVIDLMPNDEIDMPTSNCCLTHQTTQCSLVKMGL